MHVSLHARLLILVDIGRYYELYYDIIHSFNRYLTSVCLLCAVLLYVAEF